MSTESQKGRKKTLLAVVWMLLSTGLGKTASLIAQVVLGWVLVKEDFGLYALAFSISSSVSLLRNGGAHQILIQRGEEYDQLAPKIIKFSFIFNIVACLVLVVIAPISAKAYNAPELIWMVTIIGLAVPVSTTSTVLRAKLLIDHRFKAWSLIDLTSSIIRQGSMIVFAVLGFSYMAFVWPILIEAFYLSFSSYFFVKSMPKKEKITKRDFLNLFSDAKWIMLGALAAALGYSGQYFIIGIFENKQQLGIYFFGFQLVLSIATIFTYAMENVFFPMLASIKNNKDQLEGVYINAITTILFVGIPVSILGVIFSKFIVNFVWNGKWDEAIKIIQYLVLALPGLLILSINRSVLEAKGAWGQRLSILTAYVVGDMAIAGVAAWVGSIELVALCTCIFRNAFSLIQCGHISYVLKMPKALILTAVLPTILITTEAVLLTTFLKNSLAEINIVSIKSEYLIGVIFLVFFVFFNAIF
jgi:PST family polysaccharide transporter